MPLPNANRSNRHCLSIQKMPRHQRRRKLTLSSHIRRLIVLSLLTTEILARSKHSSSKRLLLHDKLPKPPKGASKLTYFCIFVVFRVGRRSSCSFKCLFLLQGPSFVQALFGLLLSYPLPVVTLSFNPATLSFNPATLSFDPANGLHTAQIAAAVQLSDVGRATCTLAWICTHT